MSLLASLVVPAFLLLSPSVAEQTPAVFRDAVLEITMPPGIQLPTPTKAPDASNADYSTETANGIYRIQHAEMGEVDTEKMFGSILANIKQAFRLEKSERFTHQGYPGLRMTMSQLNVNQVMRMDCLLVKTRLVRVWYIARSMPELDQPAVRAFFDSLRLQTPKA
jgi:hypothetical protein